MEVDGYFADSAVTVHFHPEVDGDDVAFLQLSLRRRNPVNDLAVHRRAKHAWIAAIPLERRVSGFAGDFFLGKFLEVHRRHSRPHAGSQGVQHLMHDQTRTVHLANFVRAAQMYRHLFDRERTLALIKQIPYCASRTKSRTALATSSTLLEAPTSRTLQSRR